MWLHETLTSLSIYRNLLKDPVISCLYQLVTSLEDKKTLPVEVTNLYFDLLAELAKLTTEQEPLNPELSVWQNHLLSLILFDDNSFTKSAELDQPASLAKLATFDLSNLEILYRIDWQQFKLEVGSRFSLDTTLWPNCGLCVTANRATHTWEPLTTDFHETKGWEQLTQSLVNHYLRTGSGLFGRYQAFKWTGSLVGISNPDPIKLDNLVGYESQKQQVLQNTRQFIQGYPANNLLLYGDRGTGKSATVKALVNELGSQGLRLIEIQKDYLGQLPQLLQLLRGRGLKFIIFIDDLSFEEFELEYKALKAILEGSLEVRPENVLVYATSNRRHLIKELHSDKLPPSDELHQQDTVQEKLSLADRFGQTITYVGPLQYEYLQIVDGLAAQRHLPISTEELHRLALQWELSHNVRSGRTARQFIDHLEGQLLLSK